MENENKYQTDPNVQQGSTAAFEPKKKNKKIFIILGIIAAVIILLIVVFALGGSKENESAQGNSTENNTQAVNAVQENKKGSDIGNYGCKVKSAELCKDSNGKNAVIVTYEFTNNSNEVMSFASALTDFVYQNDVELEIATLDEKNDIADDSDALAEVEPGATKEIKKAYVLNDDSTSLKVEIFEAFSLNDEKITKTVKITK